MKKVQKENLVQTYTTLFQNGVSSFKSVRGRDGLKNNCYNLNAQLGFYSPVVFQSTFLYGLRRKNLFRAVELSEWFLKVK